MADKGRRYLQIVNEAVDFLVGKNITERNEYSERLLDPFVQEVLISSKDDVDCPRIKEFFFKNVFDFLNLKVNPEKVEVERQAARKEILRSYEVAWPGITAKIENLYSRGYRSFQTIEGISILRYTAKDYSIAGYNMNHFEIAAVFILDSMKEKS